MSRDRRQGREADVCLVLEGGLPDATGGVSVWLRELTKNLPDVRFAIANVRDGEGASAAATQDAVSENVVSVIDVAPGEAGALGEAAVYHACLTGHASDTAALAADLHGRPMLLTEHGLAWREAGWISGCGVKGAAVSPSERRERVRRVGRQAREAYARADAITTVCSANLAAQRRLGAPVGRSSVIPNCFRELEVRAAREPQSFTVGFVGRVVPVKDVLTLIRAAELVRHELPAKFVVVGPLDHDPAYAERCQSLVRELGLEEAVEFVGEADPADWYGGFDALALTSLSEAQPLVLLEAMAAGLPAVATRVGGCEELLAGSVRGRRMPLAGLLVSPGNPAATADAIVALGRDPELRRRLGAAGRERARQHHHPAEVWGSYRSLYDRIAA